MYVSSVLENCKGIAKKWKQRCYAPSTGEWDWVWPLSIEKGKAKVSAEVIYDRLVALKGNGTPEEIEKIVGNTSWTDISCDECGRNVEVAVTVGEEEDYDTRTARVCLDCLNKAVRLARAVDRKRRGDL
jgi:hypothetical protein